MVLGVHWDTTAFIDSFNDNDSGVAAIIEVAKALIEKERIEDQVESGVLRAEIFVTFYIFSCKIV